MTERELRVKAANEAEAESEHHFVAGTGCSCLAGWNDDWDCCPSLVAAIRAARRRPSQMQ